MFEGDLEAAPADRIALPPVGAYRPVAQAKAAPLGVVVLAEAGACPGSYRLLPRGGGIGSRAARVVHVHDQLIATQRARVTGPCAIRDHAGPRSMRSWRMRATVGWSPPLRAMLNVDLRALCIAPWSPVHARQCAGVPVRPGLSAVERRWNITTKRPTRPARLSYSPGAR
ncbi:MAG: hypothetical protein IPN75_18355 [Dechloromonas sp.]|uniref:Uncharacterized protein n=1 Tax=Candidatus Dechloromonas phosphorivorans TaxID=2899244 RepID=A0A9D7LQZ5_9RHOO|nr:hypothetical protein [Candidatus Dechloromonas phosphorivorans]